MRSLVGPMGLDPPIFTLRGRGGRAEEKHISGKFLGQFAQASQAPEKAVLGMDEMIAYTLTITVFAEK